MVRAGDTPTSSSASKQGHGVKHFLARTGGSFKWERWDPLESLRSMPRMQNPLSDVDHEDSLHKAVAPQDADKLEKAFQDLQCLECLWLDMEEEENVQKLIDQVPLQLGVFHEVLQKAIDPELELQFRKGYKDLKQNWKQEGDDSTSPIGAEEVQESARDVMMQAIEFHEFVFKYKHRLHTGFAVHVLSLHPDGGELLGNILESKADPSKFCSSSSKGRITLAEPFHVAAGGGQMGAAELLLEANVNVDVLSYVEPPDNEEKPKGPRTTGTRITGFADVVKRVRANAPTALPSVGAMRSTASKDRSSSGSSGGREAHYTALHEATFFQQEQMVRFLIVQNANVNNSNLAGDTALHWAARQGNACIARLLVGAKADLKAKNKKGKTALETAVDSANFPGARLGMLMQRQISEIMTVAKSAPSAAKELLRDVDEGGSISPSWRPRLLDRVTVDQWVELMELAPQVAEDVLEAVTVTPVVENNDHYPLPRQARFWESENMRVKYAKDEKWAYNAVLAKAPAWHKTLIPTTQNFENKALRNMARAGGFERKPALVRVKMVRVPGLMNRQVLRALKDTDHFPIFTKLAAQAIIQCAWETVVKRFYYVHLLYRTIEIGFLVAWTFLHFESGPFRQASWSFLLAHSSRELFYELCEIRGYMLMRQGYFVSAYLMDAKNLFDLLSIFMLLGLCIQTWTTQTLQDNLPLLAAVVASRWVQLVYTFRAFPTVGQKLLPIIQSFRPLSGIFFITIFIFMGFLHAFLVLNSELQTEESIWEVFTFAFRFLFLGDDAAADVILGLGGREPARGDHVTRFFLVLGIMGFSILILNLFIAGAHQAYEEAHNNAETRFFQERADISLQCLFRPTFPGKVRRWMALVSISISIPTWLALLMYVVPHPALASLLLFATTILSDSILMQHNWSSRARSGDPQVAPEDEDDEEGAKQEGGADAEDTDAPVASTPLSQSVSVSGRNHKPVSIWEQKYLWFCYRVECEDAGDGSGEMGGSGTSLMGRKAVEALRSNRVYSDLRRLRRDTENLQYNMDFKMSQMKDSMQSLSQDMTGRLDRLERAVTGLVANIERVGLGSQSESQSLLPEGWESARAPNGRVYYYNRALKKRQWEKPAGPPAQAPAGGPTPLAGGRFRSAAAASLSNGMRSMKSLGRSGSLNVSRNGSGESSARSGNLNAAGVAGFVARPDHPDRVLTTHGSSCSPIAELPGDVLSMSASSAPGTVPNSREASATTLADDAQPHLPDTRLGVGSGSRAQLEGPDPAQGAAAPAAMLPASLPHADGSDGGEQPPGPCSGTAGVPAAELAPGAEAGVASSLSRASTERQRPEPLVDLT